VRDGVELGLELFDFLARAELGEDLEHEKDVVLLIGGRERKRQPRFTFLREIESAARDADDCVGLFVEDHGAA
jgi:hypothetical protein